MFGKQPLGSEDLYSYWETNPYPEFPGPVVELINFESHDGGIVAAFLNVVPDTVNIEVEGINTPPGATFTLQKIVEGVWEDSLAGLPFPGAFSLTHITGDDYRFRLKVEGGILEIGSAEWYNFVTEGGDYFIEFDIRDASEVSLKSGGAPAKIVVNFELPPPPPPVFPNPYSVRNDNGSVDVFYEFTCENPGGCQTSAWASATAKYSGGIQRKISAWSCPAWVPAGTSHLFRFNIQPAGSVKYYRKTQTLVAIENIKIGGVTATRSRPYLRWWGPFDVPIIN
jgi:hypothetical protein